MYIVVAYRSSSCGPATDPLVDSGFALQACHSQSRLTRVLAGFFLQNLQRPDNPPWELSVLYNGVFVVVRGEVCPASPYQSTGRTVLFQAKNRASFAIDQWNVEQDVARRRAADQAALDLRAAEYKDYLRLKQQFEPKEGADASN